MAVALPTLTIVPLYLALPAAGLVSVQARPVVELVQQLEELLEGMEGDEIEFPLERHLEGALVQAALLLESLEADYTRVAHQVEPLALKTLVTAFPKAWATPLLWGVLLRLRVAVKPVLLSLHLPDQGAVLQD